jgi:hypothetical protein
VLKRIEAGTFVAIIPLGSEAESVVFEGDPDVCRVGFGVPFRVGSILRTKVLAWLPPLGPKDLLAKRVGITRPFGVVRVVAELPLAVSLVRQLIFKLEPLPYFLAPARPIVISRCSALRSYNLQVKERQWVSRCFSGGCMWTWEILAGSQCKNTLPTYTAQWFGVFAHKSSPITGKFEDKKPPHLNNEDMKLSLLPGGRERGRSFSFWSELLI